MSIQLSVYPFDQGIIVELVKNHAVRRVRTLSEAKAELAKERADRAEQMFTRKPKMMDPKRAGQIIMRATKILDPKLVAEHRMRQALKGLRQAEAQDKEERRQAKKRTYNKGAIASVRGTYYEDALQTARADLIILDSGSIPIGAGTFKQNKGLEPGEFVADPGVSGDYSTFDPPDLGPIIPGDQFVRHGKGRPVGRPAGMISVDPRSYKGPGRGSGVIKGGSSFDGSGE